MLDFGFYNLDCMDGMKEFPDKYFDLAVVDPPYGISVGKASMGLGGGAKLHTQTDRRRETVWFKTGDCYQTQNLQGVRR